MSDLTIQPQSCEIDRAVDLADRLALEEPYRGIGDIALAAARLTLGLGDDAGDIAHLPTVIALANRIETRMGLHRRPLPRRRASRTRAATLAARAPSVTSVF